MKHSKLFLSLCLMFIIIGCVATFSACLTDEQLTHVHTWAEVEGEQYAAEDEPACKGVYYKSCSGCGMIANDQTFIGTPLSGHVYDEELILENGANLASTADCDSSATYYYVCSLCHEAVGTTTFASGEGLGHTKKSVPVLDESSSDECLFGHSMVEICTKCGAVDPVYLTNYRRGKDWTLVTKPSCSFNAAGELVWTTGAIKGKCIDCGKTLNMTLPATLPNPYAGQTNTVAQTSTEGNVEAAGYYTIKNCTFATNCSVADVVVYTYKIYGHLDGETCLNDDCSCKISFTVQMPTGLHTLKRADGSVSYMDPSLTYYYDDYPELELTGNSVLSCAVANTSPNSWFKCAKCEKSILITVNKHHQLPENPTDITVITQADCENDGEVLLKCALCGQEDMPDIVPKTGHNYSYALVYDTVNKCWNLQGECANEHCPKRNIFEAKVTVVRTESVNATCKQDGYEKVRTANKYGDKYVEGERKFAKLNNHRFDDGSQTGVVMNTTNVYLVSATFKNNVVPEVVGNPGGYICNESGVSAFFKCADCGQNIIVKIRFDHTKKGEATVINQATCTEKGKVTYVCDVCHETQTEETPALDHQYQWKLVESGNKYYMDGVCGRCDGTTRKGPVSVNEVDRKPAKCNVVGSITYACTMDGKQYTIEVKLAMLDHLLGGERLPLQDEEGEDVVYDMRPGFELTGNGQDCSQGVGSAYFTCEECGRPIIIKVNIAHTKGTKLASVKATCTVGAYDEYNCAECGQKFSVVTSEPLGHDYTAKMTVNPTYSQKGNIQVGCKRCDFHDDAEMPVLDQTNYQLKATDPTCEAEGKNSYTYVFEDDNGKKYTFVVDVTVAALGHAYNSSNYETSPVYTEWDIYDTETNTAIYHCKGFYCTRCESLVMIEKTPV